MAASLGVLSTALFAGLGRIDALGTRLDSRIDVLGARLDGRLDVIDGRIDALGTELRSDIRDLRDRLTRAGG